MPTISGAPSKWEELGRKLERRRVERDPRYKDRAVFARDTGVNDRMLGDLERARRTRYRDTSLQAVEIAYQLKEDAIRRFVTGKADRLEVLPDQDEDIKPEAPAAEWDGEMAGPDDVLHADERLLWKDEAGGRFYRLADKDDASVHAEHLFYPGETPPEVIDDLRDLLAPFRVAKAQMERRRARR